MGIDLAVDLLAVQYVDHEDLSSINDTGQSGGIGIPRRSIESPDFVEHRIAAVQADYCDIVTVLCGRPLERIC